MWYVEKKVLRYLTLFLISVPIKVANGGICDHKRILLQAFEESKKIKSGHYDIICHHKFPFKEEVKSITGHCTFSMVPTDPVLGARVSLIIQHKDGTITRKLYDGHYDVILSSQEDRKARVSDLHHRQQRTYYIAGSSAVGLLFKPLLPVLIFSKKGEIFFPAVYSETC